MQVADPGFRRWGVPTSKVGRYPIIWPNFYEKLHRNERIWTRGACPWRHPLDHPMTCLCLFLIPLIFARDWFPSLLSPNVECFLPNAMNNISLTEIYNQE